MGVCLIPTWLVGPMWVFRERCSSKYETSSQWLLERSLTTLLGRWNVRFRCNSKTTADEDDRMKLETSTSRRFNLDMSFSIKGIII